MKRDQVPPLPSVEEGHVAGEAPASTQSAKETYRAILKEYWGYDDFRGIQLDIIESIGQGHDTLGLMPTGGGKSITFQVPALAKEGLCLVVTPLIALMKDQVAHLKLQGIKASAIYSGLTHEEILVTLDNCIFGGVKFLYVSPERLSSDIFLTKLKRMKVSFITVDEAHCISQWGYDFRPSYLEIANIRKQLPGVPVLALTATATPEVAEDIQRQLAFSAPRLFRMSFERKNLSYVVREAADKEEEALHILRHLPGSSILYVRSRKGTKELASRLSQEGIPSLYYHAGLSNSDKDIRQKAWQTGQVRVMVATNAFGMGIDKPDVRSVIHLDTPDSIEAYFQEAGRAGRDGLPAYAILLYNNADTTKLKRRVSENFPDREMIRNVYEKLAFFYQLAIGDGFNVTYPFNIETFCIRFKCFPAQVLSSLRILTRAGYIEYIDEDEYTSRLYFLVERDELYHINRLPQEMEDVIRTILRLYGGMFSDYVGIREEEIAAVAGTDANRVYEALLSLTQQRIIHYIPRKRTPYITYKQRRVEKEDIVLRPEVYDDRKAQYATRIDAMIDYATSQTKCRSRMLLNYFGEKNDTDCGQCDVCLAKRRKVNKSAQIKAYIRSQMADGLFHFPQSLQQGDFDNDEFADTLEEMMRDEEIGCNDRGEMRLKLQEQR